MNERIEYEITITPKKTRRRGYPWDRWTETEYWVYATVRGFDPDNKHRSLNDGEHVWSRNDLAPRIAGEKLCRKLDQQIAGQKRFKYAREGQTLIVPTCLVD